MMSGLKLKVHRKRIASSLLIRSHIYPGANARALRRGGSRRLMVALLVVALVVAPLLGLSTTGLAMPTGGEIVSGDGSFDQSGNTLTISQLTDWLGIDWRSFNIGADELVVFAQPGAGSVALNRVLGPDPSEILGRLQANGQVFLVNPQGVLFGADARVDVGGLVASALDLRAADFDKGIFAFGDAGSGPSGPLSAGDFSAGGFLAGRVVNMGEIAAQDGGYIAFVGTQIENAGWVLAPLGTVAFGAGERVTLGLDGRNLVSLSVDEAALGALIDNSGLIAADGGAVLLDVRAQDALQDTVLNMDGIVRARSMIGADGSLSGGSITLSGGEAGVVHVTGTLDASGTAASAIGSGGNGSNAADSTIGSGPGVVAPGGRIQITGEYIALDGEALLDASGTTGGEILVGGDYQGANPDVQNARAVFVGEDVVLDASARDGIGGADSSTGGGSGAHVGDGGRVIVWSDELTRFLGTMRATGADSGGDGGFAEVSSAGHLDFRGLADLRAPRGEDGTLLLDPHNVFISNRPDSGGNWSGGNFTPPNDGQLWSDISVTTLLAQLRVGNVIVRTASSSPAPGTITVEDSIIYSDSAPRSLTLEAEHSIIVRPTVEITSTNAPLHVALMATRLGVLQLQGNNKIETKGGNITLNHGYNEGSTSGDILNVTLGNNTSLDSGGGAIHIVGAHKASSSDTVTIFSGSTIYSRGGDIKLQGLGNGSSLYLVDDVAVDASGGNVHIEAANIFMGDQTTLGDSGTFTIKMPSSASFNFSRISIRAEELVLDGENADFTFHDGHEIKQLLSARAGSVTFGFGNRPEKLTIGGPNASDTINVSGTLSISAIESGVDFVNDVAATHLNLMSLGPVTQSGTSAFNVGTLALNAGDVDLANGANVIGAVNGIAEQLRLGFAGDLHVGRLTVTGTVALLGGSAGTLTQSSVSPLDVGGLALYLPAHDVTLTRADNNIGVIAGHVRSLELASSHALTIGSIGALSGLKAESVALTTHGADVTQDAGAVIEADALSLDGSGRFALADVANSVVSLQVGAVSDARFYNAKGLELRGITGATGDVRVHAAGDLGISGNIVHDGTETRSLFLRADRTIVMGANTKITSQNAPLHVIFNARATGAETGRIALLAESQITTRGGDIVLAGGLQDGDGRPTDFAIGVANTGNSAHGVFIERQVRLDTGAGNISISGRGYGDAATARGIHGQSGNPSQRIQIVTTSGNISMEGHAGQGPTAGTQGIYLVNATVESSSGNITLSGTGYDARLSEPAYGWYTSGLDLTNVRLTTGSAGRIELFGRTNSPKDGGQDPGANAGIRARSLSLTTASGDILLDGEGRYGVFSEVGIDGGEWKTTTGNVIVRGVALQADFGLVLGIPINTISGDVTFVAHSESGEDSIAIRNNVRAGGALYLQPRDADTAIGLWGGAGQFNLSAFDLTNVAASANVVVGSDTSVGKIAIGSGLVDAFGANLALRNRGAGSAGIEILGSLRLADGKALTLSSDGAIEQQYSTSAIVADTLFVDGPSSANNKRFRLLSANNSVRHLLLNTMNGGNFSNAQGPLHVQFGYGPGVTEMALHGFLDIATPGDMSIGGNVSMYEHTSEPFVWLQSGGRLTHEAGSHLHAVDAVDVVMEAPEISLAGSISGAGAVVLLADHHASQEASSSLDVAGLLLFSDEGDYELTSANNVIGALGATTSGDVSLVTGGDLVLGWTETNPWGDLDYGVEAGRLSLTAHGIVSQLHALDVGALALRGNGVFDLSHTENRIANLAANVPALYVTNASDELVISTMDGIQGIQGSVNNSTFVLSQYGGTVLQETGAHIDLGNQGKFALQGDADFNLPSLSNRIGTIAADVSRLTLGFRSGLTIGQVALDRAATTHVTGVTADRLTLLASDTGWTTQDEAIVADELSLFGLRRDFTLLGVGNQIATLGDVTAANVSLALGAGGMHIVGDVNISNRFYLDLHLGASGDVTQADDAAIRAGTLQFQLATQSRGRTYSFTSVHNQIAQFAATAPGNNLLLNNATDLEIISIGAQHGVFADTFSLGISGQHTVTQGSDAFLSVGELNLHGPDADFFFTSDRFSAYRLRSASARNLDLNVSEFVLGGTDPDALIQVAQDLSIVNRNNWLQVESDIHVGGTFAYDGRNIERKSDIAIFADELMIRGRGGTVHFDLASPRNEVGRLAVEDVFGLTLGFTGDLTIGTVAGVEGVTLQSAGSNSELNLSATNGTLLQAAKLITDRLHIDAPHMDLVLDRPDNAIGQLVSARVNSLEIVQNGSWTLGGFSKNDVISVAGALHARAVGADADLKVTQVVEYRGDTTGEMVFAADRSVNVSVADIGVAHDALGRVDVILNANWLPQGAGNVQVVSSTIDTRGGQLAMGGGTWNPASKTFSARASGLGSGTNRETSGVYLWMSDFDIGAGSLHVSGQGAIGVHADTANIVSTSGHITIDGVGTGSTEGHGVDLRHSSITSETGDIVVSGQSQGTGSNNHGISIPNGVALASDFGDITLSGRSRDASSGVFVTGSIGRANATGDITFIGDNEGGAWGTLLIWGSGSVQGQGDLYFAPIDPSQTMAVAGGPGQFIVPSLTLNAIQSVFNRIVFGHESGTGTVRFGGNHTFNTNVVLRGDDIYIGGDLSVGGHRLTLTSEGTVNAIGRLTAHELLLDGGTQGAFDLSARNDIATLAAQARVVDVVLRGETTITAFGGMAGVDATDSATFSMADINSPFVSGVLSQTDESAIVTPLLTLKSSPFGSDGEGDFRLLNGQNRVDTLRIEHAKQVDFGNLGTINVDSVNMRNWVHIHAQGADADVVVTGDIRSFRPHNRLVLRADRSVILDEDVTIGHGGDGHTLALILNADADGNEHGNIQMLRGSSVSLNNGSVYMGGGAYDPSAFGNPLSGYAYGISNGSAAQQAGIYMEDAVISLQHSGTISMMGEAYAGGFGVDLVSSELRANGTYGGSITIAAGNDGTGDSIRLSGSMIGGYSNVLLLPLDRATTIGMAGGDGVFNLSLADLAALGQELRKVEIGSSYGTGDITFGDGREVGYAFAPEWISMLTDTGVIRFDSAITANRLSLTSNSAVSQGVNGALTVGELSLFSEDPVSYEPGSGVFTLDAADNRVGALTTQGRSVVYRGIGAFALGWMEIDETVQVVVDGDITIDVEASSGDSIFAGGEGDAVVLVAGGNFHVTHDSGTNPFETPNGRFLVYSTNPDDNKFGRFSSPGNLFGRTFVNHGPETIDAAFGSRMIYSFVPTLSVSADDVSGLIYGANHDLSSLTWTIRAGLVAGDTAATALSGALTTGITERSDAGTHRGAITQGTLASSLGYEINFTPGDVIIDRAQLTITGDQLSRIYGEDNAELTWTHDGLVAWDDIADVVSVLTSTAATKQSGAGDYVITITGSASVTNYDVTYVDGKLAIDRAQLTITGNHLSKIYGDDNPGLTWTHAGLMSWDDMADVVEVSATTDAGKQSGVGDYVVTIAGPGSVTNYDVTYVDGKLTIDKAQLTITGDPLSKIYGDDNPDLTWKHAGLMSWDDIANVVTVSAATTAGQRSGAGEYKVTISGPASTANYDVAYVDGKLTIDKAQLTITGDQLSKIYGDDNPELTWTHAGLMSWDDVASVLNVSAATTPGQQSDAGEYVVAISGPTSTANYDVAYVDGKLTINKARLTIAGDQLSKIYGDDNPEFTWTHAGLRSWDDIADVVAVSATTDADKQSSVGDYVVTIAGSGSVTNYDVTYADGRLTINKARLTITGDQLSKIYGDDNPELTWAHRGLMSWDDIADVVSISAATAANKQSGVGEHVVSMSGPGSVTNYDVTYVDGKVFISPATITIRADDAGRPYGTANPSFTVSYDGFKLDHDESILQGVLAFDTLATLTSEPGSYIVTPGGLVVRADLAGNYDLSFAAGTLIVYAAGAPQVPGAPEGAYGAALNEVYRWLLWHSADVAAGTNDDDEAEETEQQSLPQIGGLF